MAAGIGNSYNQLYNQMAQNSLQEMQATADASNLTTQESLLNTKLSAQEQALKQSESTLTSAAQASMSIAKAWSGGIAQA